MRRNDKKKFCCYKITNLINGKSYIGKTKADPSRRWNDHIKLSKSLNKKKYSIHYAINKYGVENFEFKILRFFKSERLAYIAEKNYIKKYKTYTNGYNETIGGQDKLKKINRNLIIKILRDYAINNLSSSQISKKYNYAKPCVLDVLHFRNHSLKVSDDLRYQLWLKLNSNNNRNITKFVKLTPSDIQNIFIDNYLGLSKSYIARKYNIAPSNVTFILNRKTWKNVKIKKYLLKSK